MPIVDPVRRRAQNAVSGRTYRLKNPAKRKRTYLLGRWRKLNVNPWPYASLEELHDNRYIVAEHCEYCTRAFADIVSRRNPREMEHDHRPPFLFRAISCHSCNRYRAIWDARVLAVRAELIPTLAYR